MEKSNSSSTKSMDFNWLKGGAMMPVFLNDLHHNVAGNNLQHVDVVNDDDGDDLVEVTLKIDQDHNSIVLCNIAPPPPPSNNRCDSKCSSSSTDTGQSISASSRTGQKFQWLRTLSFSSADIHRQNLTTRESMKLKAKLVRTKSSAQRALGGLRFINKTTDDLSEPSELWKIVESRFDSLAKNGLLSRYDFADCIGMSDTKEFALGVFDVLARRCCNQNEKIGCITKSDLQNFWSQITDQSFDARLQIFFDMADSNEDGRVTRDEVQELIMLSASANKLSKLKDRADEYAALIMEELDPENLGYIELWQLEALLLQRDIYMNYSRSLSTASVGWSQNIRGHKASGIVCQLSFKLKCLVLENWQRCWILFLWLSVMAGLFAWKFLQYKEKAAFQIMGYCLTTAKGAAETLKLNMALILLPVCRNILTCLRSTRARLFIPFNDNINFHKIIACAIGIGILIHAGNHMACDFPRLINSPSEKFSIIASDFNNTKPSYTYLLTGVEGMTGISMVILLIVAFTLATPHFRKNVVKLPAPFNRLTGFNAFWFSHHLTCLVYILLLVHGNFLFLVHKWYQKTTWMYISVPLFLYVAERSLRTCRSEYHSVKVLKVSILPGNVFNIIMSKPSKFRYKSGQYIFLQCPSISSFEWHPFSITSAPGDDYLSVHIRTVGDWTKELKRVFTEDNCSPCIIGRAKFGQHQHVEQTGLPKLCIDGPYGAPAQDYQHYDILLLVGLGIGATPFISILRDLINNTRTFEDQTDSNTENSKSGDSLTSFASSSTTPNEKHKSQRTKSSHFYWVTREPGSFEWFEGVMNEVAEMDHKGQIEMHNYLTSVYEEGDARSTLIKLVQALNHAKHGVDILSGTRVRTHFARPNWKEEFTKIALKHPFATVGVFYCGMPMLAKELKELSNELTRKTSTRFEFHKEYF